jgi:subtilisin family serine protease
MSTNDSLSKVKKHRRSLCRLIVIMFLIITVSTFALDHAARQTGARQRVWPLGYKGDPNMSVAIFDTGINASHQSFSPGFTQNGDWNSKIVFWYAVEESGSTTPVDDTELGAGHGTHAAGIIAGKGHGLVDTYYDSVLGRNVYRLVNTNAYTSSLNLQYSEQTALRVNAKGLIEIKYAFDSDRGNCDAIYLKFGNVEQAYQPVGDTKIMVGDNVVVASLTGPVGTPNLRSGSTTPDEIQWNTITYRIEDESQYGTYHIITQRSGIASGGSIPSPMAFEYVAKYPVDITLSGGVAVDPEDGLPYYLGMAPDVKLFGVQAASATTFIDSVNALWSEFTTYHVGVPLVSQYRL